MKQEVAIYFYDAVSGINEKFISSFLQPFVTTREGRGKKGVGLSLPRSIVEMIGNVIEGKPTPEADRTVLIKRVVSGSRDYSSGQSGS